MIDLTTLQITNLVLAHSSVLLMLGALFSALRNKGGSKPRTYLLFLALAAMAVANAISATAGALDLTRSFPEHLFEVRFALVFCRTIVVVLLLYYIIHSWSRRVP